MATTHYSELKVFALSTPGVENACCEFDVETLRPTYHLLIGIPGKSNAFAIAGKLGLPDYIIEEARTHLTEQDESFEDLLTDLEASKRTIQKEQEEISAYKRELARLEEETRKKREKLEEQKEKILRDANEKAFAILAEAKETADETMRNFHKFGKANISAAEIVCNCERCSCAITCDCTRIFLCFYFVARRNVSPSRRGCSSDEQVTDLCCLFSVCSCDRYFVSITNLNICCG